MANNPIRVLNFNILAQYVADELLGFFHSKAMTMANGISTPITSNKTYPSPYTPFK